MNATEPTRDASELLQNLLVEDRSVTGFLDGLAALAARHMGGQREVLCGILLQQAKKNTVVASSSTEAQRMDELQAGFNEGPCLAAQRTNTLIVVTDIRDENRWPDYMDAVRDHGLHSIVAIPLTLEGTATAAMNFYSRDDAAFDDAEIADAQLYAELAAKALLLALRTAAHSDAAHHRQSAMESRTAIDTAIGIIMAQNKCDQTEAFTFLQRASSDRNIKLRVLAEELVAAVGHTTPATTFDP